LKDAVVYGVEVPGAEGRAGMAAILDPEESLDMEAFGAGVKKALPPYSRPLFVRIIKQMDMTGTYKMKKIDLQKEGYDVTKVADKIYVLTEGKYNVVDNEIYSKIMSGQMRL
jgi:solute carrier family 27 fatty acid transporter 1/4